MFKKSGTMAKNNEADTGLRNHIAQGTKIVGEITAEGDIRIDGEVDGQITSKGKLVVGPTGTVRGEARCAMANIAGQIEGKLHATEMVSIQETGVFSGEMVYGKMSVEPGAALEGQFTLSGKLKDITNERQREQQSQQEKTA